MPESVDAGSPRQQPLNVFISYSRSDLAFVDELVAGLEYDRGFEVAVDRTAIHEGEDWKTRLGALIAFADTVVFVLSRKSASSAICQWEVDEAARLGKRVLPILIEGLGQEQPPDHLAALNYVRFDPHDDGRPRSFMQGLTALRRAINTDVEWLREHTRLLLRAREWQSAGHAQNRLLSGTDIANAQTWLDRYPKDAPPPTDLHRDYIQASAEAEAVRLSSERKRAETLQKAVTRTRKALVAVVVLAIAAGTAIIFATQGARRVAEESARAAQAQLQAARDRERFRDVSQQVIFSNLPPLAVPYAIQIDGLDLLLAYGNATALEYQLDGSLAQEGLIRTQDPNVRQLLVAIRPTPQSSSFAVVTGSNNEKDAMTFDVVTADPRQTAEAMTKAIVQQLPSKPQRIVDLQHPLRQDDFQRMTLFGWALHPILRYFRFHSGVTYHTPESAPVFAAGAGSVVSVGRRGGLGDTLEIDHGHNVITRYGHLTNFAVDVKIGTKLNKGQVIGHSGTTGLAAGPQIFFGVDINGRAVDPLRAISRDEWPQ